MCNSEYETSSNEDGFTLIEVMVTMMIIGLMIGFVVLNVLPSGEKAKTQKARADIATLDTATQMYRLDMFDYPPQQAGLNALLELPAGVDAASYRPGGYIRKLPNDPWGNPYLYRYPGENGEVDIYSLGQDGEVGGEGQNADIGNWQ